MALTEKRQTEVLDILATESGFRLKQVESVVQLLQEGGTVPFIARYRKEQTGELDEVQIRDLADLLDYQTELAERKEIILASIDEQGKLTPELATKIEACRQKTALEDLYLPYKPKRRTKATIAKERGLEPLADIIEAQDTLSGTVADIALPFVNAENGVADTAAAIEGAAHILAERLADDATARAFVRRLTSEQGLFSARVTTDKKETVTKFEMYYDYQEPLKAVPSHRMLAMRRGEKEEVLLLSIIAPTEEIVSGLKNLLIKQDSIFKQTLISVAEDAYKRLIAPSIEVELRLEAKNRADETAIKVFADNLRNLLLLPPAGNKKVLGVDPGLRTGSKLAAVDDTGRFLEHVTIYPHSGGSGKVEQAKKELLRLLEKYDSELIAIGNGTAGREMEQFVKETLREQNKNIPVIIVNEAGASIYSASDIAREEFPELDLTIRGAISIARRLQDPLAELVKIDPKSIGVGQYQHDVNQSALKKSLEAVVESCVNYVGVDLNTASWALLSYVSGIGESLAKLIVKHRDDNGIFASRKTLLKVTRFGPKAFEQAAGFLRIRNGKEPLDNTAVHPERYALVEQMAKDQGITVAELANSPLKTSSIELKNYVSETVGLPTLKDIVAELQKPGRDPRKEFKVATLRDDVLEINDLHEGMVLEGTVTNVAAFGAFVDIGVHQDGLVHVSHLANHFIKEPNDAVKVGEVVKVKVLSVDAVRKRIALSIKDLDAVATTNTAKRKQPEIKREKQESPKPSWEQAGFRVKSNKR